MTTKKINHIKNPGIIRFVRPSEKNITQEDNRLNVPYNANWQDFRKQTKDFLADKDSVMLLTDSSIDKSDAAAIRNISIKSNGLNTIAKENDLSILSQHDGVWYLLNPDFKDRYSDVESNLAPSDEEVVAKFESFNSKAEWQEHQDGVWSRMKHVTPLLEGDYQGAANHVAELTSLKRGLGREDLEDFWSWRSGMTLNPDLYDDNFIGMPGIESRGRFDFVMTPAKGENAGKPQVMDVRVLRTVGPKGYMIPMANENGHITKYQVGTDSTTFNTRLKPRAADGISIQHSEIYNKNHDNGKGNTKGAYTLLKDGEVSNLFVKDISTGEGRDRVTFQDIEGEFTSLMGEDLKPLLTARGYEIPPIIDSLRVTSNAKYMWQSPGNMIGSTQSVRNIVSPSDAGFIISREPNPELNENGDYIVIISEGALKGHIVSKYMNNPDADGEVLGDVLDGGRGRGLIIAQVPGVSEAFIKSVRPIYDKYNVAGTYIAMDADGRDNLSVAKGIHNAEEILKDKSKMAVLAWAEEHKGLDDALIAMSEGKIKIGDLGLQIGTPEQLFPLEQAQAPNPYKLDGTRANRQEWMIEHGKSVKNTNARVQSAQEDAQRRAKELEELGKDLDSVLPEDDKNKGQKL